MVTEIPKNKKQLLWLCRRGMLELDFLLERFMDKSFDALDVEQRVLFELMLKEQDPVLYSWLLGYEQPQSQFIELIEMIRKA